MGPQTLAAHPFGPFLSYWMGRKGIGRVILRGSIRSWLLTEPYNAGNLGHSLTSCRYHGVTTLGYKACHSSAFSCRDVQGLDRHCLSLVRRSSKSNITHILGFLLFFFSFHNFRYHLHHGDWYRQAERRGRQGMASHLRRHVRRLWWCPLWLRHGKIKMLKILSSTFKKK